MSITALTTFISARDSRGRVQAQYQNSKPGETISYSKADYPYLSFIYQGAAKNRTGDNLEAALVLAVNEISTGIAVQAVREKWNVQVYSCSMNPNNFTVAKTLTVEHWIASSLTYDVNTVEILLSSSVDAVGAIAPNRVLTQHLVGALPSTGQISNR